RVFKLTGSVCVVAVFGATIDWLVIVGHYKCAGTKGCHSDGSAASAALHSRWIAEFHVGSNHEGVQGGKAHAARVCILVPLNHLASVVRVQCQLKIVSGRGP